MQTINLMNEDQRRHYNQGVEDWIMGRANQWEDRLVPDAYPLDHPNVWTNIRNPYLAGYTDAENAAVQTFIARRIDSGYKGFREDIRKRLDYLAGRR